MSEVLLSADQISDSERDRLGAQVVAFYLPQFHRIPENDKWWGEGFTEWSNVRRARPYFAGHRQPQLPGELGFYDLLDPQIHKRQQELAATHGISAFCYYAYWFNGRRLLERPLELVLHESELRSQFLICWANENWTRTWDGLDQEILVGQRHDPSADAAIIDDLEPMLCDPRYLKIRGKPVLLIYRSSILNDAMRTTDSLRERASALGIGDIYLGMVQSFGSWDPRPLGFDGAVEFPPHNSDSSLFRIAPTEIDAPAIYDPNEWQGTIFSYPRMIEWMMSKNTPNFPWFRCVMPGWDNTARRLERASAFVGDRPELFQIWLERALHHTYLNNSPDEWLVFVNSWNEWGEGAYLEPDFELGRRKLEAIAQALENTDQLAQEVRSIWSSGKPVSGGLLETARTYMKSSAILAREELCRWYGS
jgi:lipopolysaccharide biosynthesis protein